MSVRKTLKVGDRIALSIYGRIHCGVVEEIGNSFATILLEEPKEMNETIRQIELISGRKADLMHEHLFIGKGHRYNYTIIGYAEEKEE